MASPLASGKQSVNLGSSGVPGSRIRRDPPPAVKELVVPDVEQREWRTVIIGILSVTIALIIILIGISSISGWTPRDYIVQV
jgi:hypothetical protein